MFIIDCMEIYYCYKCCWNIDCFNMGIFFGCKKVGFVKIWLYCIVLGNLFEFQRYFLEFLFIGSFGLEVIEFFKGLILLVLRKSQKNHLIFKLFYFCLSFLLKTNYIVGQYFTSCLLKFCFG